MEVVRATDVATSPAAGRPWRLLGGQRPFERASARDDALPGHPDASPTASSPPSRCGASSANNCTSSTASIPPPCRP